jgi:hypothetical protein
VQLTSQEQQTLRAVVDRIIPPDDYPAAWQVGVGDYLERQFETDLRHLVPTYRAALAALNAEAAARHGAVFATLTASLQDDLLRAIEAGEVRTAWPTPPRPFFRLLVQHTAEGYYGSPINGGNHGAVSWHMIGFGHE